MSRYTIRQIREFVIQYSEGGRTMEIQVDWRDPVPAFSFEQVSMWNPPHEDEAISRDRQEQILTRIAEWLKPQGYDRVFVTGHGYLGENA